MTRDQAANVLATLRVHAAQQADIVQWLFSVGEDELATEAFAAQRMAESVAQKLEARLASFVAFDITPQL